MNENMKVSDSRHLIEVDPESPLVAKLRDQIKLLTTELIRLRNGDDPDNGNLSVELLEYITSEENSTSDFDNIKKISENLIVSEAQNVEALELKRHADEMETDLKHTRKSLQETKLALSANCEELKSAISERDLYRQQAMSNKSCFVSSNNIDATEKTDVHFISEMRNDYVENMMDAIVEKIVSYDGQLSGKNILLNKPKNGHIEERENSGGDTVLSESQNNVVLEPQRGSRDMAAELNEMGQLCKELKLALSSKSEELKLAISERELYRQQFAEINDANKGLSNIQVCEDEYSDEDENNVGEVVFYKKQESFDDLESSESAQHSEENKVVPPLKSDVDDAKMTNNPSIRNASVLYNTGVFLIEHNAFEDSIPCLKAALQIRREFFDVDDASVGDALHMWGEACYNLGEYDRAQLLLWDALGIRNNSMDSMKKAQTYLLLGDLHVSKQEFMKAALIFEDWLEIVPGHEDCEQYPEVLIKLARVKHKLGETNEAFSLFQEVLGLWSSVLDGNDERMASLHETIGHLALQRNQFDKGEHSLNRFIQIRKANGTEVDTNVANALVILGNEYGERKLFQGAHSCWLEAFLLYGALGFSDEGPCIQSLRAKIKCARLNLDDPAQNT